MVGAEKSFFVGQDLFLDWDAICCAARLPVRYGERCVGSDRVGVIGTFRGGMKFGFGAAEHDCAGVVVLLVNLDARAIEYGQEGARDGPGPANKSIYVSKWLRPSLPYFGRRPDGP